MKSQNISGTQSLRRALQLLRLIGAHHVQGMKLTEVVEQSGLERSTAHRLLACLCEEQFTEKSPHTKRYHLGLASMQIGYESSQRLPLVENCRPVMQRLARISGDTVFLIARQGDHAVCLHIEEGNFPVKITTTTVGNARPLGIGAAGTALLAALPDDEINRIYERQKNTFEHSSVSFASLRRVINNTRRNGFSQTVDIITPGIAAVGAVIPVGESPFAAMSIGSITPRMGAQRRMELGRMLQEAFAPK